jgi:predicted PurR-regulated permease PerM
MADVPPGAERGRSDDQSRGVTGMLTFLTLTLVVAALYFGREVLVPFALAVLLSFMLAPAVHWLRHMRAGRVAAVAVTVLVAFLAIFAFGAVIAEEMSQLGPALPEYRYNIESKLRTLPRAIPLQRVAAALHQATADLRRSEAPAAKPQAPSANAGKAAAEPAPPLPVEVVQPELTPAEIAKTVIGPLLQPLATAGLVVVLVIFILLEREELRDRVLRLVGSGDLHRTTEAMNEAAGRVSRYLLSQLSVNAVEGTLIGVGLAVIGIPNAALWGILVILLRFIPYLGVVVAAGVDGAAVRGDRARRRQRGRALALRRQHRPVLDRGDHRGGVLDLAVGADWVAAIDPADRLPARSRPACAAAALSRSYARQRAGADARRNLLPAAARR